MTVARGTGKFEIQDPRDRKYLGASQTLEAHAGGTRLPLAETGRVDDFLVFWLAGKRRRGHPRQLSPVRPLVPPALLQVCRTLTSALPHDRADTVFARARVNCNGTVYLWLGVSEVPCESCTLP